MEAEGLVIGYLETLNEYLEELKPLRQKIQDKIKNAREREKQYKLEAVGLRSGKLGKKVKNIRQKVNETRENMLSIFEKCTPALLEQESFKKVSANIRDHTNLLDRNFVRLFVLGHDVPKMAEDLLLTLKFIKMDVVGIPEYFRFHKELCDVQSLATKSERDEAEQKIILEALYIMVKIGSTHPLFEKLMDECHFKISSDFKQYKKRIVKLYSAERLEGRFTHEEMDVFTRVTEFVSKLPPVEHETLFRMCDNRIRVMGVGIKPGTSLLHLFAHVGDAKSIRLFLIESDPCYREMRTSNGRTPLHFAAGEGGPETIRELLKDANPEYRSMVIENKTEDDERNGFTALHCAAEGDLPESVEVLLEDSEPEFRKITNRRQETALHLACKKGKPENIAALLKDSDPEYRLMVNVDKYRPLDLFVAQHGKRKIDWDTVNLLIRGVGWCQAFLKLKRKRSFMKQFLTLLFVNQTSHLLFVLDKCCNNISDDNPHKKPFNDSASVAKEMMRWNDDVL